MILVAGGTGFVGTKVVHALRAAELPVRVLARRPERQDQVRAWGCEVVQGDMTDPESLRRAVEGCDVVVHMVAILLGSRDDFERIMVQGTRDLVEAAKGAGVRRIVLMSAQGTEEGREVTPYFHAKWEEEQAVKYSGLEHVIFRPSFVFGSDGGILPQQIRLVRYSPVTPILGRHRMQPIWIDDVAAFYVGAISGEEAANRTFDLGGPDRLTWADLHALIRKMLGKRRLAFTMPPALLKAGATAGQLLPPLHGARAAVEMLDLGDNICDPEPAIEAYGVRPIGVEEQVRRALAAEEARRRRLRFAVLPARSRSILRPWSRSTQSFPRSSWTRARRTGLPTKAVRPARCRFRLSRRAARGLGSSSWRACTSSSMRRPLRTRSA